MLTLLIAPVILSVALHLWGTEPWFRDRVLRGHRLVGKALAFIWRMFRKVCRFTLWFGKSAFNVYWTLSRWSRVRSGKKLLTK